MPKQRRLLDTYTFPGFRPLATVVGIFGDPKARLVRLLRRGKKQRAGSAAAVAIASTIARFAESAICPAAIPESFSTSKCGAWLACGVAP